MIEHRLQTNSRYRLFTEDKLGNADLIEEVQSSGSRTVKVTGVKGAGQTVSIVCRGANSSFSTKQSEVSTTLSASSAA
jgi:hypothetical protein